VEEKKEIKPVTEKIVEEPVIVNPIIQESAPVIVKEKQQIITVKSDFDEVSMKGFEDEKSAIK